MLTRQRLLKRMRALPHFTRDTWPMWGAVILSLALMTAFIVWRITIPSDGTWLPLGENALRHEGVVIRVFEEKPNGLRDDDVVVAIDGQSMESQAQSLFRPGLSRPNYYLDQTTVYTVLRDGQRFDINVRLEEYPLALLVQRHWLIFGTALLVMLGPVYIFIRRSFDRAARLVLVLFCAYGVNLTIRTFNLELNDLVTRTGFWLYMLLVPVLMLTVESAVLHLSLIFPKPAVLPRHAVVIPLIYITPLAFLVTLLLIAQAHTPTTLDWLATWPTIGVILVAGYQILLLIFIGLRYRQVAGVDLIAAYQVRWIVAAYVVNALVLLLTVRLPQLLLRLPIIVSDDVLSPFYLLYLVALGIGILRYRLFDIDVIINRALVYGALTLAVVATYMFLVVFVGGLLRVSDDLPLSLFATGIVAVGFERVREMIQRAVNRLVYGQRDEPYAVISRLGKRLETALAPEAVLPTIVETVGQALKLPYAAIALKRGDDFELTASYSPDTRRSPPATEAPTDTVIPLIYQQETIGQLMLAPRAPGESFTPADRRLLDELARHAGVAAHNVRLTSELLQTTIDLQRSRERLVAIREEERRRLSRDLHDGLGPVLASQRLNVGAIRKLIKHNPAAADELLSEVQARLQEAITDVRRLVHELRPPILNQLGLVGAIRQYVDQGLFGELESGVIDDATLLPRVSVEAPDQFPSLPAAIEVAAYRIVLEALTNVIRYAGARSCLVRLVVDHPDATHARPSINDAALEVVLSHAHTSHPSLLRVEVIDDGIGIAAGVHAGIGLMSMRERAVELGGTCLIESSESGGTRVTARFPLPEA